MNQNEVIDYLKSFEKDGFYLHADQEQVENTVKSLLANQEKYGHLACPCRLATGDMADDEDIICPCIYCKDDIEEFGSCYCLLLVKETFKDDPTFFPDIDDRRPPEKVK